MRIFALFFLVFLSLSGKAAYVVWSDYYRLTDLGNNTYEMECLMKVGDQFWYSQGIDLIISLSSPQPDLCVLMFDRNPDSVVATPQNWVSAQLGDVVSAETTRNLDASQYLMHDRLDDGGYVGGQTQVIVDRKAGPSMYQSEVYLAFAVEDPGGPPCIYGWVGLDIGWEPDGTGYFSGAWGAYDVLHGPMVVGGGAWEGGIPEPSGGILFLLGVVMLGLRRVQKLES